MTVTALGFIFSTAGVAALWRRWAGGWFAPLLTITTLTLALYPGALAGYLEETARGLFLGGLVCLLWHLRTRIPAALPGLGATAFLLGSLPFLLQSLGQKLTHYDNFSHWALAVKYLLVTGSLPGADTVLVPFRDYPPGATLWVYYCCAFLGRGEGIMLLAQTAAILACFAALFGVVEEHRRFLLYAFLAMGGGMISYLNLTIRINSLLVDFLLPLLTLASAAMTWRMRRQPGKGLVCLLLVGGFTTLVKDSGLFFAGAALGFYLWVLFRQKAVPLPERAGLALGGTGGVFLPRLAWSRHLATALAGLEGKFSFSDQTAAQAAGPEDRPAICRAFLAASLDLSDRAAQGILFALVLTVAVTLWVRWSLGRSWHLLPTLGAAGGLLALYYGGLLGMYLFLMPREEAVRLAGLDRYACSGAVLFGGLLLLWMTVELEGSFPVSIDQAGPERAWTSPQAKRRYQKGVLAAMVIALNFLYSEWNGLAVLRDLYPDTLPGRVEALAGDHWPEDGRPEETRYLVAASDEEGQVTSGEVGYVCRYFLFSPNLEVTTCLTRDQAAGAEYLLVLDSSALDPEMPRLSPGLYPASFFQEERS